MLSIGLERPLQTRKTDVGFIRNADTIKSAGRMREPIFRQSEIPGVVEIFKDDIKIGSFMTIEVAKKRARFDKSA